MQVQTDIESVQVDLQSCLSLWPEILHVIFSTGLFIWNSTLTVLLSTLGVSFRKCISKGSVVRERWGIENTLCGVAVVVGTSNQFRGLKFLVCCFWAYYSYKLILYSEVQKSALQGYRVDIKPCNCPHYTCDYDLPNVVKVIPAVWFSVRDGASDTRHLYWVLAWRSSRIVVSPFAEISILLSWLWQDKTYR